MSKRADPAPDAQQSARDRKFAALVTRCAEGPVTRQHLCSDLATMGVRPGIVLIVHTSLSALGFIAGGPKVVLLALRDAVGADGTLVLPAFHWQNSEPSHWTDPPVPESWWQTIRNETPGYDPQRAPCDPEIGALPEIFRKLPGVLRSGHPSLSWCAEGPQAERVTAGHKLDFGLDDGSPLGRCYELDAWVLSLGCRRTTVLHFAESRTAWAQRHLRRTGSAMLVDGQQRWVEYDSIDDSDADFEALRLTYMAAHPGSPNWAEGPTGYGASRLFRVRPLVDFGTVWLDANRKD